MVKCCTARLFIVFLAHRAVAVDRSPKQLAHALLVAALTQDPHGFGNKRLGRHVVTDEDARMVEVGAADLVNAQVTALLRHLRRDDDEAPGVHPVEDGALKRGVLVLGDASNTERFDDDGVVVALEQLEDARTHLGSQL